MVKSKAVELTSEAVEPVTELFGSSRLKIKSLVVGVSSPVSKTGELNSIINWLEL